MATTTKERADAVRVRMRCRDCAFEWEFDFVTGVATDLHRSETD